MSAWSHALCTTCYSEVEPGRVPYTIVGDLRKDEKCCRCGKQTGDGIYYRADPTGFQCHGDH